MIPDSLRRFLSGIPRDIRDVAEAAAQIEQPKPLIDDDMARSIAELEAGTVYCTGLHCNPKTLLTSWNGQRWVTRRCSWCGQDGAVGA